MTVAITTEAQKHIDPRVQRTRKLLEQSFLELIDEKGFQEITIQDIADRATVNRATFYAHFEDKFDLFNSLIRQQFNAALRDRVPLAPRYTLEQLDRIIITVMEFLAQIHKHCARPDRQVGPLLVNAIQEELMLYLRDWFALATPSLIPQGVDPQTAANVWSWAIFGTATQWAQGSQKAPAGEIAQEISRVLTANH